MPTIKWTTENTVTVDSNDVGSALEEIMRNYGFRHNAVTAIVGAITIEESK